MRGVAGIVIALWAMGSAATAEDKLVSAPWSRTPSWAQMQAAFPQAAKTDSGSVTLRCSVGASGALSDCTSREEKPAGQGFNAAAQSLAPLFTVLTPAEAATGTRYLVDVPFSFTRPGTRDRRVLQTPKWVHWLEFDEARALFPAAAPNAVKQGVAILRCQVTAEGALRPCTVVAEKPEKRGFGAAAMEAASRLTMNPWGEGFPVEGLSLTFALTFTRP